MKPSYAKAHDNTQGKKEAKAAKPPAEVEEQKPDKPLLAPPAGSVPKGSWGRWQARASKSTHKERKLYRVEHEKQDEELRQQEEENRRAAEGSHRQDDELQDPSKKKSAKEEAKVGGKKAAKEVEVEPGLSEFQAKAAERDRKMKEAALAAKLEVERERRELEERKELEERRRLALKRQAVMLPRLEAKVKRDTVRTPFEGWAAFKRDKRHGRAVVSHFTQAHKRRSWFMTLRNLARDRKHRNGVEAAFTRSVDLSLLCEHIAAWSALAKVARPMRPAPWDLHGRGAAQGGGAAPLPVNSAEFQPAWPLAHGGVAAAAAAEHSARQANLLASMTNQMHHPAPLAPHGHDPGAGSQPPPQAVPPPQHHHAVGFQQALRQPPPPSAEELRESALAYAAGRLSEGRGLARAGLSLDALECFQEALKARTEAVGEEHPLSVEALYECGLACPDKGRAVELLTRCVDLEERARGELHPEAGQCMLGAGMALLHSGSEAESLAMLARAAAAFEATVGQEDPRFKRAVDTMLDIM